MRKHTPWSHPVQGINFKDKHYYINKFKECLGIIVTAAMFDLLIMWLMTGY